jgi:hypothetical protein
VAVQALVHPLDRGEVLGLEGDPVEEGHQARGGGGVQRDAQRAGPLHEPMCGPSGFT